MEVKKLQTSKNRDGEKGAAMVTVLLIAFLLLTASAGILLEATVNTANVTDAVAEQQAYNTAESGIQTTLNVLRGNVAPNPLLDTSKPATDQANKINFIKALKLATSNKSGETGTEARLSRWMPYDATDNDRVKLVNSSSKYAYKITLDDPDNTGDAVSFTTTGSIIGGGNCPNLTGSTTTVVCGSGTNIATISYVPSGSQTVIPSSSNTNFGSFQITNVTGTASVNVRLRYVINVAMTAPYSSVNREIRGWIETGSISSSSVGNVRLFYDSQAFELKGSFMTLSGGTEVLATNNSTRIGYQVTPNAPNTSGGITPVSGSMTQAEPSRLLVRSTGYGPRGATKVLEAIVQKNFFDGLSAPATLTLVGSTNGFFFDDGNSQNVTYSGDDIASNLVIPPVGTTNNQNLTSVVAKFDGKTDVYGTPSNVLGEMPFWLQSATNLNNTLIDLKTVATSSGRYFASGQTPSNFGDYVNARGITFVDGDVSMSGAGGGILVVTGKLTLNGGVSFKGLIIVTGAGGVDRHGGGNGLLQGNVVVAPYDSANLAAGFLGPKYDISGGGNSEMRYDSSSVDNGLVAVSNFVLGVAEK